MTNMNLEERYMTLDEYQKSPGLDKSDQICLLGRHKLYHGYFDYLKNKARNDRIDIKHKLNNYLFSLNRYFKNNDQFLFLGYKDNSMDFLEKKLLEIYEYIKTKDNQNFILLIGKGDYEFKREFLNGKPENLLSIAANNVNTHHPDLHYLPMGRDFRSQAMFSKFPPQKNKKFLCYCNFSLDTHPIRENVYSLVKDKEFIKFSHMGKFSIYSLSSNDFYEDLSSSKFCICPRGNGIDTFRLWDALYVGTVPIVVNEAVFHEELHDLPILFLDEYKDLANLSIDFLENQYKVMLNKKYNYSKLAFCYWKSNFESKLIRKEN